MNEELEKEALQLYPDSQEFMQIYNAAYSKYIQGEILKAKIALLNEVKAHYQERIGTGKIWEDLLLLNDELKKLYTEEFPTVLASNIAKDIVNAEKVYIPTRYKIDKNKDYVLRKDVITTIKEMEGVDTKELIRVINLLTLHN